MNIGYSSRIVYDDCYYEDRIAESTGPMLYRLDPNNLINCNACLSTLGPRSGYQGYGVSTTGTNSLNPTQALADIESVLSNRNVPLSKCRSGRVNNIDITKFKLNNARICNEFLDPMSSRLTYPAANYRSMSINRFYDLPRNPQEVLFWDGARNTKLESKDNFVESVPSVKEYNGVFPKEIKGPRDCSKKCNSVCAVNCNDL